MGMTKLSPLGTVTPAASESKKDDGSLSLSVETKETKDQNSSLDRDVPAQAEQPKRENAEIPSNKTFAEVSASPHDFGKLWYISHFIYTLIVWFFVLKT